MNANFTTTVTTNYKTKRNRSFGRKIFTLSVILFILFVALVFVGCASVEPATKADPKASSAAPVEEPVVEEEPEEEVQDGIFAFGETATWENNVSISVSEPEPYAPSELSAGAIDGNQSVIMTFVLTNNSSEKYEPYIFNTASSGGEEASAIFDTENGVEGTPMTAVLPGKTIKWVEAYSVADPADITLQVSAGFEYTDLIYTSSK